MDRQDHRLLVDSQAIFVHQEHQHQATTLVRRGLTGVSSLEVVVQVRIPGVDPVDATLVGVLDEGDVLTETAVEDDHARGLEEDTLVFVTIVVGVDVLFRFGEVLHVAGPANASKGGVLQEEATLGFVVEDLGIHQLPHLTLVLFSI